MAIERPRQRQRPSPEHCCGSRRERRGRPAQDFLGAAPGVGKTYEMLQTAQAKRREGIDVVVGVVETHGRRETEALLAGLEIIPRRRVEYKGRWLDEMDLDAILAAPAATGAGRRARAHQRPGQPASEAVHGCRGTARRRHRCLYDAQHPARRKPQRCRGSDHPHPRARNRAGFDYRPGRRYRTGRSHAGRSDPAAEGRQGLCPAAGRAGHPALFLSRAI